MGVTWAQLKEAAKKRQPIHTEVWIPLNFWKGTVEEVNSAIEIAILGISFVGDFTLDPLTYKAIDTDEKQGIKIQVTAYPQYIA